MNSDGLSDKKEMALELVMSGMADGEIAKRVGVSRQWMNTWRNQDAEFMYALEMRRQALREKHMDSLGQLVEKAIGFLGDTLEEGDAQTKLKAAMYVLKVSGVQGQAKTGKATPLEELELNLISAAIGEAARETTGVAEKDNKR